MERESNTRVITLADLWGIFIRRLWLMILAAVVAVGAMFAYVTMTYVPRYESTATLYVLRQPGEQSSLTYSDFTLAMSVVNDCTQIMKSRSVLDEVINELNLDTSYRALYNSISTANPADTRILQVRVLADSPDQAKRIVDRLCEIGADRIEDAMTFRQVNLYEYGAINTQPANRTGTSRYALAGLVAAVLVYAVFLVLFLVDDRIRTEEDIERHLGLSVLGDIPNAEDVKKRRDGYYYGYQSKSGEQQNKS